MKIAQPTRLKSAVLLVAIAALSFISVSGIVASSVVQAQTVEEICLGSVDEAGCKRDLYAREGKCGDGTQVPERDRVAGTEAGFCSSHGGFGSTGEENNPGNVGGSPLDGTLNLGDDVQTKHKCGGTDSRQVSTSIDLGCKEVGNPIIDVSLAIARVITAGVGVAIVISVIIAGIQYSASQGNPQATAAAVKRIAISLSALLTYLLAFALLNWLNPGGVIR